MRAEFDALLAEMQTPKARDAVEAMLRLGPGELGEAALRAAERKHERVR